MDPQLHLEDFLPYRLSVLANTISTRLATVYSKKFGLRIPEWRVLAVLGSYPDCSAREVAERTAMDKVAVSRAVASLTRRDRICSTVDPRDRRRTLLRLTPSGRQLFAQIAPLARDYESLLLARLGPGERRQLDRLLAHLLAQAGRIGGDATD